MKRKIYPLLVILLMLSACVHMSAANKALTAGSNMTNLYLAVYDQYNVLVRSTALSNDVKITLMTEVAPILDKAKKALIQYNDLAVLFASTGTKPAGLDEAANDATAATAYARSSISKIIGGAK